MDSLLAILFVALCAPRSQDEESSPGVSSLYAPGDEAHWVFEKGGTTIGRCASRYAGALELAGLVAHRFEGQVVLELAPTPGAVEQRLWGELLTDERGRPLRFVLRAQAGDMLSSVELTVREGKDEAKVVQGPSERSLEVDVPEDAFLLANNFLGHLELILALAAPAMEAAVTVPIFSGNTLRSVPLRLERAERFERAGVAGTTFRDSLGEVLFFTDEGRLIEVEVPAQGVVIRRSAEPFDWFRLEPPEPPGAPAEDFQREDVRIEHGAVSLGGTLTRGLDAAGRQPAVFFVSGSGGQDRDGFSSGIDLGTHQILDRLTREGFLVLRVDDRGVGASKGPLENLTFDDLVADAQACVEFLLSRSDVDPHRVAVIGHSEGAQTAPLLARALPELAGIVLMAGPGRPVTELLEEQLVAAKRREGATAEALAAHQRIVADFVTRLCGEEEIAAESVPTDLRPFLAARAWLQSHARQDPLDVIAAVECPVLILQGGRDIQVSPERDAQRLAAALERAGHPDFELVVFPELDHLFKPAPGGSTPADYFRARAVDGEFLDVLVGWLKQRLMVDESGD